MATKDLINLGISPDSGTGDSARKGGAKVNDLISDVYSKFGDNPIGQDVDKPFYGYRRRWYKKNSNNKQHNICIIKQW